MRIPLNRSDVAVRLPDEVADFAREHTTDQMHTDELLTLAAALAICPVEDDAIVVEVGTFRGQTAAFMGRVLRSLQRPLPVLSIDAFELLDIRIPSDSPPGWRLWSGYTEYLENIRKYDLEKSCMVMTGFSQAAAAFVAPRIALLVVDGDHVYDSIKNDIDLYSPKVIPGGIVFFDDYSAHFSGVVRAVDEFLQENPRFEMLNQTRNVVARRLGSADPKAREKDGR